MQPTEKQYKPSLIVYLIAIGIPSFIVFLGLAPIFGYIGNGTQFSLIFFSILAAILFFGWWAYKFLAVRFTIIRWFLFFPVFFVALLIASIALYFWRSNHLAKSFIEGIKNINYEVTQLSNDNKGFYKIDVNFDATVGLPVEPEDMIHVNMSNPATYNMKSMPQINFPELYISDQVFLKDKNYLLNSPNTKVMLNGKEIPNQSVIRMWKAGHYTLSYILKENTILPAGSFSTYDKIKDISVPSKECIYKQSYADLQNKMKIVSEQKTGVPNTLHMELSQRYDLPFRGGSHFPLLSKVELPINQANLYKEIYKIFDTHTYLFCDSKGSTAGQPLLPIH